MTLADELEATVATCPPLKSQKHRRVCMVQTPGLKRCELRRNLLPDVCNCTAALTLMFTVCKESRGRNKGPRITWFQLTAVGENHVNQPTAIDSELLQ